MLVSGVTTRPLPNRRLMQLMTIMSLPLLTFDWFIVAQAKSIPIPPDALPLFVRDAKHLRPATTKHIYAELFDFSLPKLSG